MAQFDLARFEEQGHEEGTKFWFAHEFMVSLGYDNWTAFQKVVTKAMGACAKLGIDPTESFVPATYNEGAKECKTYKLSRFACFLVSMYADSNKPEVALARAALAAIAGHLVEERIRESDLGRLETRDDLKMAERALSGAASTAGLETSQFGIFKDAGFRGMYNMSLENLQMQKGVSAKQVLYDFMGLDELAGNLFRVTQTTARINSSGVRGLPALQSTAQQVGKDVRGIMIKNSGTPPEKLAAAEDISDVKKRLKAAHKEMKKMDGKAKSRKSLPSKAAEPLVKPEDLHDGLLDYLNRSTPDDLLILSSQTIIDGIADIEISDIKPGRAELFVSGTATVEVILNYGSGEDHTSIDDAYPMHFDLVLDEDRSIYSMNVSVDTSSFYA